jgi:hypothetical protein
MTSNEQIKKSLSGGSPWGECLYIASCNKVLSTNFKHLRKVRRVERKEGEEGGRRKRGRGRAGRLKS